ncbi:MAG: hypothetical protein D6712_16515 [Chloroflexi bacterium]|nr:MAG: hypothetical protein D6712_16515 [Chloroflexota bacterium]
MPFRKGVGLWLRICMRSHFPMPLNITVMKAKVIKMLASVATDKVSLPKGKVVRVPAEVADDLIGGGLAVLVKKNEVKTGAESRIKR